MTLREALKRVWAATDKQPEGLKGLPTCPPELYYIWVYFCELCSTGTPTYSEIDSWSRVTNRSVTSFEVQVIMKLSQLRSRPND